MDNIGCGGFILLFLLLSVVSALLVGLAFWGLWAILAVGVFGLIPLPYWTCVLVGFCLSVLAGIFKVSSSRKD